MQSVISYFRSVLSPVTGTTVSSERFTKQSVVMSSRSFMTGVVMERDTLSPLRTVSVYE